jgi:hypothetical protein
MASYQYRKQKMGFDSICVKFRYSIDRKASSGIRKMTASIDEFSYMYKDNLSYIVISPDEILSRKEMLKQKISNDFAEILVEQLYDEEILVLFDNIVIKNDKGVRIIEG